MTARVTPARTPSSSAGVYSVEPRRGCVQTRDVRVEPEREPAVDPRGLERAPAAQEPLVVGVHDGLGGIDRAAAGDGDREERQRSAGSGTREPTAASSGAAFVH